MQGIGATSNLHGALVKPPRRSAKPPAADEPDRGGGGPILPAVGTELFGFHLRCVLGRGAFALIFLAEDASLASRPVVLKVSSAEGDEPQTLAQLQHTHIVPIYSVYEDAALGLRAVCMPYFGGASLADVLHKVFAQTDRPVRGQQLVQALEAVAGPAVGKGSPAVGREPARESSDAAPLTLLQRFSYVRAAAWITARLAEALQHAHQRGVLHRDIKPSNILLGADGQPMLLDFNVALNLNSGKAKATAVGGTVAYMAPEHLRALATHDPALARLVDQRADIYSLGMVLYEVLAGCRPFEQSGSYSPLLSLVEAMAVERGHILPSLRKSRSDVPWSLESIARKCLAPDPEQRYQRAEQLAEDLRRFLEDRPLKYAPELSRAERIRKWIRRHPHVTSSGTVATVAGVLLLVAGTTLIGVHRHLSSTQGELQVAQTQECMRAFEEGTTHALCLVNTTGVLRDHLVQGKEICARTLNLYGVLDRDDWENHPHWQGLNAIERLRLANDVRELLLLLAWTQVHTESENPRVIREALALLDRAQAICQLTPLRALWEDRADYLRRLGNVEEAQAAREKAKLLRPTTARDHYLLATAFARGQRYQEAVAELDQAVRLSPKHFWSWMQRGICHQELGQFTLAAGDFGMCMGLWPEFAWGYFNRGYALSLSGHKKEAISDYGAALDRDPAFLLAYLNRGMSYLELAQYKPALADFDKAIELGQDDAVPHAGRGAALEGLKRFDAAAQAFQVAFTRCQTASREVRIRIGLLYGFAVANRQPDKALQAFADVLQQQPEHPQALYGRALLLVDQGQLQEALAFFNRAVQGAPHFVEARRYRAILLARQGDLEQATKDINWCLEREGNVGATLYAGACVAALAVQRMPQAQASQRIAEQALELLEKAISRGYGQEKAALDSDLKAIHSHPGFQRLVKNASLPEHVPGATPTDSSSH
jgi:serine/threonine protein kinase/tetratricopeptide (TPR) repeat protein